VQAGEVKSLIVGVDLDGVCADFYGRMREIAAEFFERRVDDLPRDVSFGLREWGVKDMDQYYSLHRFAVTQRGLFEAAPMIPGARKYLRLLSDEGARVGGDRETRESDQVDSCLLGSARGHLTC
jgi:hypothetical protein